MNIDLSRTERETLKSIYRLTKGSADVHTGALADALGVSPGTATASVKKLAERKLLQHRPYKGVELTRTGRRAAISAIRRHRIVERFLSDMLGYAWNEADRLAGSLRARASTRSRGANVRCSRSPDHMSSRISDPGPRRS